MKEGEGHSQNSGLNCANGDPTRVRDEAWEDALGMGEVSRFAVHF